MPKIVINYNVSKTSSKFFNIIEECVNVVSVFHCIMNFFNWET
jgi:hypothetical protein